MKRRLLYGSGVVLMAILVTLVVWQGSFEFGNYAPSNPTQTWLYWAVSTLVFLLTVTVGFMLFRTAVKLYIERRSNKEGSRIKTKLVVGALGLSFMPVFFLVLWGVYVLNRNLDKWFSRPLTGERDALVELAGVLDREARAKLQAQADLLASLPQTRALAQGDILSPSALENFCQQNGIQAAAIERPSGELIPICPGPVRGVSGLAVAKTSSPVGTVVVAAPPSPKVAEKLNEIKSYVDFYNQLHLNRRQTTRFYIQLLFLLTLFILFFATWLALFLARQISVPISALALAAGEVRKGNLGYRVQVKAIDELATLVRAFNEMTRALEANRQELETRRRFTEAILESIPSGVISLAPDGRILRVNRALRNIFPTDRVARAEKLEDLFSREDTAEIKYLMKRARRVGAASSQIEMRTEQQTLHLAVTVSALETKITLGFVLVVEDTSELLRAQKAAAWREVARRIAHEIKNPLTPITLSAERIERQLARIKLPQETERIIRECTGIIVGEVDSLKTLLGDFSQFARFPASQPVPSDLNEVVVNALNQFIGRLDGIEVCKDLAPELPPVKIDRELFRRVVANLVDNAAESMQESLVKRLYVATRPGLADTVELVIADTGCGISPEDKEKLFLPYFSTKGRGTGLGLAIVSHILADHNASIRVEDNLPVGARFIVELPALTSSETEPKQAEANA
jgi:PAS domain S-box-containing protein